MKRCFVMLNVLSLVLSLFASQILLAGGPPGGPPNGPPNGPANPEQIALGCIAQTTFVSNHCVHRNEIRAAHCVEVIGGLLAKGDANAAQHVADMCIHRTNYQSNHCIQFIEHRSTICSFILNMLSVPDLAEQVQMNGQAKAQAVQQSREAAIQAITAALKGGG